jgi:hypothetical protein
MNLTLQPNDWRNIAVTLIVVKTALWPAFNS